MQIRRGTTMLSSFTSDTIELGANSTSAQIEMAGGSIIITGESGSNTGSLKNRFGSGISFHSGGFGWQGADSFIVLSAATAGYQAAYGYHPSTLDKLSWDNILGAVTLYQSSSGSTGTISLSPSSSNYWYMSNNIVAIEIFYTLVSTVGEQRYASQKIYDPNGKTVMLSYTTFRTNGESGTNTMYFGAAEVTISLGVGSSGRGSITFADYSCGSADIHVTGTAVTQEPRIKILKVVGYR